MLLAHIKEEYNLDLIENTIARARLKCAAEKAKIELSSAPYAAIEEDHIAKKDDMDMHLSYELSKMEFESMIEPLLQKTIDSVNKALKDAAMLPSALDKNILVGGSTRIPRFRLCWETVSAFSPLRKFTRICVSPWAPPSRQAGKWDWIPPAYYWILPPILFARLL